MSRIFALEWAAHFLTEKRNKSYKWYGEVSIAGKKCAGRREPFNRSRLVLILGKGGA